MGRCVVAICPCKTALRSHEADITLVAELVKRRPGHATAGQSTTSSEAQGMSEREKANQDFEERALEAIRVDTTKMSSNDDHKYNTRRRGLNLIGFTFDGDARLRMSLHEMFRDATVGAPVGSTISISHPIIELFAVHPHPDRQMALLAFSD
ncbi:TPA: hypothetical protein ACH3X1_002166 [Trebouxia sp. C0004]